VLEITAEENKILRDVGRSLFKQSILWSHWI